MKKDWRSAGDNQPNLEPARTSVDKTGEVTTPLDVQAALLNSHVQASQLEASHTSAGKEHGSPDPLFKNLASDDDLLTAQPRSQLEPIQPGSEQLQFCPNPRYDPFAPEDGGSVKNQEALQVEAPQSGIVQDHVSANPSFDDLFADLVPELTPEDIQDLGKSMGPSGDFANHRSSLFDPGLPGGALTSAEAPMTGLKRKTMGKEPNNGSQTTGAKRLEYSRARQSTLHISRIKTNLACGRSISLDRTTNVFPPTFLQPNHHLSGTTPTPPPQQLLGSLIRLAQRPQCSRHVINLSPPSNLPYTLRLLRIHIIPTPEQLQRNVP